MFLKKNGRDFPIKHEFKSTKMVVISLNMNLINTIFNVYNLMMLKGVTHTCTCNYTKFDQSC